MRKSAPQPPRPDRIRAIRGSFSWIDHRFLRERFDEGLDRLEKLLYLVLVAVSNRDGVSFYRFVKRVERPFIFPDIRLYLDFCREHKGLAKSSLYIASSFLRRFELYLAEQGVSRLSAHLMGRWFRPTNRKAKGVN